MIATFCKQSGAVTSVNYINRSGIGLAVREIMTWGGLETERLEGRNPVFFRLQRLRGKEELHHCMLGLYKTLDLLEDSNPL